MATVKQSLYTGVSEVLTLNTNKGDYRMQVFKLNTQVLRES